MKKLILAMMMAALAMPAGAMTQKYQTTEYFVAGQVDIEDFNWRCYVIRGTNEDGQTTWMIRVKPVMALTTQGLLTMTPKDAENLIQSGVQLIELGDKAEKDQSSDLIEHTMQINSFVSFKFERDKLANQSTYWLYGSKNGRLLINLDMSKAEFQGLLKAAQLALDKLKSKQ